MGWDFSGQRVLVTGASRGIGAEVARQFAAAGARVAMHYAHDATAADAVCDSLSGSGHLTTQADLSEPAGPQTLIKNVLEGFAGLDILVNNAGIFRPREFAAHDLESWRRDWRDTLRLNLDAAAELCFLAARAMRHAGGGRIVNISSRGAFRGEPEAPAYGASKAGLNALSQSLAQALAPANIFVGVVAPGFVETDMTREILGSPRGEAIRAQSPTGRVATPADVAHAVLFLASPGAEFATGTIIDVNGASYLRS